MKTVIRENKRGVILTGNETIFCAGLDLPVLSKLTRPEMEKWFKDFSDTMEEMATSPLVVISAISGHAPAGGAVIAAMTDYRIAQQGNFPIGLNEARVGLAVPSGILACLSDAVGHHNAEYMALTGQLFSPEKALSLGFLDELVPAAELLPRAKEVMSEFLVGTSPEAQKQTKAYMRRHLKEAFAKQRDEDAKAWLDLWFSDNTQQIFADFLKDRRKK